MYQAFAKISSTSYKALGPEVTTTQQAMGHARSAIMGGAELAIIVKVVGRVKYRRSLDIEIVPDDPIGPNLNVSDPVDDGSEENTSGVSND